MNIKTSMIVATLFVMPQLGNAAETAMQNMMTSPATDSQRMPMGGPMMGRGPGGGMMGRGMGMQPGMMDMMNRQDMMERRMDMMEMMMNRNSAMPCAHTQPMMGQGMGMRGMPMMDNQMGDMRGLSNAERTQIMQHRIEMMNNRIEMMQKRRDLMQQRMEMMHSEKTEPGN